MEFLDLKYLFFSGIFLSGIWGYAPPPLNGKSFCPNTLSVIGGFRPPLTEKFPYVVFCGFPILRHSLLNSIECMSESEPDNKRKEVSTPRQGQVL